MKENTCRCCLADNCNKDLYIEHQSSGQSEIYYNLLMDTFNINLSKGKESKSICDSCITKLRQAAAFKKQVLYAEDTFFKWSEHKDRRADEVDSDTSIKSSHSTTDDDYIFDHKISDDCMLTDDELAWQIDDGNLQKQEGEIFVIKLEPKQESDNDFTDPEIIKTDKKLSTNSKKDGQIKPIMGKSGVLKKSLSKSIKTAVASKPTKNRARKPKQPSQTHKNHRENTIKLIQNSNMCIFTSYKTKYGCFLCNEKYFDIKELREHSKSHSNDKYLQFRVNQLRGLSFKNVDISSLACKICSETCHDLFALQKHLTDTHNIEFHSDEHFLIPYRLESGFQCVICNQTFNTYLRLSIHMNTHSTNNVCEICGGSYINRLSLRTHVQQVHTEKKCSMCPAVFTVNALKVKHMRKVHNLSHSRRHCLKCGKTFRYTYLLIEHNIQEHGARRDVAVCGECGKTFPSPHNLRVHTRSVHIRERNYPCSVCDMRFFTKCDQRRHERTHEDVRSFACSHCEGRFKTKDSWRRHLKRQHGHLYSSGT